MGCCTQEAKYDPTNNKDGKEINASSIADPAQRIEVQFPFYRMHAKAFEEKIHAIDKDNISILELAAALNTPAWAG